MLPNIPTDRVTPGDRNVGGCRDLPGLFGCDVVAVSRDGAVLAPER